MAQKRGERLVNDIVDGDTVLYSKREKLDVLQRECNALISELDSSSENPELIVKKHIQQLKKYNELKDVALSLVSLIADQKQLPVKDILAEMKVDPNDD